MKKIINFSIYLLLLNQAYGFNLKDGYDTALNNDMDTQVRQNDLKTIEYDVDISKSLNYPKIDLTGKVETSKRSNNQLTPKNNISHTKTDEYEVKLKQPIYDGNDAFNEKKIQKARYKSAQYYLLESKNSLALKFTQAYIDMLKQKDTLNLYMESYAASKNIYNKVTKKLLKGFGTKLEYEKAKGDLEESIVNLDIQKINYKNAFENLKFYIQKNFDTNELMKPIFYYELPTTLNKAIEEATTNHPSLLVSKNNVLVSRYEQQRDMKSFHPTVDLVSSYKVDNVAHGTADEYNEYKIGVEFTYNLYNGGKDVANNGKALRKIKEKKHLIQKTKQEIKNRLSLAWTSNKLNKQKLKSIKNYVYTKKMILDAMLQEFDLGFQDLSSVLEEHVKYINVKRDLISTSYDLLLSKYRILEAMGTLATNFEQDINSNTLEEKDKLIKEILEDAKYLYNIDKEIKSDENAIKEENTIPQDLIEQPKKEQLKPKKQEIKKKTLKVKKVQQNIKENKKNKPTKDKSFKERFLSAHKKKYTINLALAYSEKSGLNFLKKHKIENNAFALRFGKPKSMYKIMLGIFDTKLEAKKAMSELSSRLKRNQPRVEQIEIKQKLYKKYNSQMGVN